MSPNQSRRALIALAVTFVAAGVAGCTKAVQAAKAATTGTSPGTPVASGPGGSSPVATSTPPSSGTAVPGRSVSAPVTTSKSPSSSHPAATRTSPPPPPPPPKSPEPTGPSVQIAHGPPNVKQVALTFHGGGAPEIAEQILTIANAKNARVTVMCVGTWLADNAAVAKKFLAAGHELGNHTWSHQDINSLSASEMRTEVVRCRDLLTTTIGAPGHYFRQSQSQTASDLLLQVAGAAGYRVCLSYDLDSMDWTDPGATAIRRNTAAAGPGSIVSMHLGHSGTVEALPGILDDLRSRGLRAVTVSTLLA